MESGEEEPVEPGPRSAALLDTGPAAGSHSEAGAARAAFEGGDQASAQVEVHNQQVHNEQGHNEQGHNEQGHDDQVQMAEGKPPPPLSEEEGFDNQSVLADEQFTQERYDEIKAKTMHQMIEDVSDKQQLLFLTNQQADLLAQPDNVDKLFGALDINHTPKLLIVLQWDGGFQRMMAAAGPCHRGTNEHERRHGPFVSDAESRDAEARLDRFMLEVLIPIAVQTNAIVICDAVAEFELSSSFLRMVAVQRASFGDTLPFFVMAITDEIHCFYVNSNPDAHWRAVRRRSRAWAKRDKKLVDLLINQRMMDHCHRYDLSVDAPMIILTDGVDAKRDKALQRGPATRLLTSMIRHLTSKWTLPSIAFRTGLSGVYSLNDDSAPSLLRAVDALNSGCPAVFLDVREREVCSAATRQEVIEKAKKAYTKQCAELEAVGSMDNLNVCALAWFHDVLFGDGDTRTTGAHRDNASLGPQALHEALRLLRLRERQSESSDRPTLKGARDQGLAPATREQVIDVAEFLTKHFLGEAWVAKNSSNEPDKELAKKNLRSTASKARNPMMHTYSILLMHEMFHGANAADIEGCRRLVQTLVKLDRLPKENTLEALELLQQAWNKHDVAVYLSGQYLLLAKALYAMILLVGVATIACTTALADAAMQDLPTDSFGQHLIFALSMANTVLLLAVKFFNPTVRCNALRSSAATLESIIWQFRARIGVFAVPHHSGLSQPSQPTTALRMAMVAWHARVVGGTDLLQTSLEREYPDKVYVHCQFKGTLDQLDEFHAAAKVDREISALKRKLATDALAPSGKEGGAPPEHVGAAGNDEGKENLLQRKVALEDKQKDLTFFLDDHQSPVRPAEYLHLRLLVERKKYASKIPQCYAWRRFWELILTACTVVSSTLSYLRSTVHWVSIASATAAAVTSWVSNSELTRHIELHSNTVRSIDDLIWWWRSLDDADRANHACITQFIQTGESILATERLSWIAAAKGEDKDEERGSGGGGGGADLRPENGTGIGQNPASGGGMGRKRVAPEP